MDILGSWPKTSNGNQCDVVAMDRCLNLVWFIPSSKAASTQIANIFFYHRVIQNGIPATFLTHNGFQFVTKLFEMMCGLLGAKNFRTTAYHPQSNCQAERINKTIVARLRHYAQNTNRIGTRSCNPSPKLVKWRCNNPPTLRPTAWFLVNGGRDR